MALVTLDNVEMLARFREYLNTNPAWGVLHIVLDDGNVDDASVNFCIKQAKETGDAEGEQLALLLWQMSKTQRKKLPSVVARRS